MSTSQDKASDISPITGLIWNDSNTPKNCARVFERSPCPFCHSDMNGLSMSDGYNCVICVNCGAKGPYLRDQTGDWNRDDGRSIALWNHRGEYPYTDPWIPLTPDTLPQLGQLVWLLHQPTQEMWIGSRNEADNEGWLWGRCHGGVWFNGQEWDGDAEQDNDYQPTHYQLLPVALPKPAKI